MGTNNITSAGNTLSLKVLSFSSQIPGYEKIKISALKMEMLPEKIDDTRIWGGWSPSQAPRAVRLCKKVGLTQRINQLHVLDTLIQQDIILRL